MAILNVCIFVAIASLATAQNLIWEDNFDTLDDKKWNHLVTGWRGGNNEFQYYRNDRKNSYVEGGILKIKPTLVSEEMSDAEIRTGYQNLPGCNLEPCTVLANPQGDCVQPVYSARLHTQNLFSVQFGRIEVRARVPSGDWLWPAIWMMPNDNVYGGWPASGEIDIVETRGNKNLLNAGGGTVGANNVGHTLHWGPRWPYNGWGHTHWESVLPSGFYSDDFHTYEFEWTADHIAYRIDGQETGRINAPAGGFWELGGFNNDPGTANPWAKGGPMAPFDIPFYLIVNVAVGGNFFDDSFVHPPYPRPWNWYDGHPVTDFYEAAGLYMPTWDRPVLEIDYVRVYSV